MKKLLIAFFISLTCLSASACDICGLGTSNYNPVLFTQLSKNYLSINYLHRLYHIQGTDGLNKEYFNTILVSGQYSITNKLQLVAMVPYQVNKQKNAKAINDLKGLGDVTLIGNYRLWNHEGISKTHSLVVGAGVKLPTGKYEAVKSAAIEEQNFQLGTGSIDYLVNGTYRLNVHQWSFSAVGSYKYNTANKQDYRYGDVLTAGATALYRKEFKNFSLAPFVQVMNEKQMMDANNHLLREHSGGNALYTGGGFDLTTSRFGAGVNYQFAAKQNLFQGEIDARPRLSAYLSITL